MSTPAPTPDHVSMLYDLLGDDAVLLPLPRGKKSPAFAGWQNTTLEETKAIDYQKRLRNGNIGVLVGNPSKGLCSIDCDSNEILKEFLTLNPSLHETLITTGQRGGNVWVKIIGAYPSTKHLHLLGEWRSTGGQTVVWGIHPNGPHYRFQKQLKVHQCTFAEINWPAGFNFTKGENTTTPTINHSSVSPASVSECCITASCMPVSPVSLYNIHDDASADILGKIERDARLDERLEAWLLTPENRDLKALYEKHVLRFFVPLEGKRNQFIVEASPRLFYAVSSEVALKLLTAFYDINASLFKDSRDQHIKESSAMLASLEASFVAKLTTNEKAIYSRLPAEFQSAFRILRDLSLREDLTAPRGQFFMSCGELAQRLGLNGCVAADRLLKKLQRWGLIEIIKKGDRWTLGAKAQATLYAWTLNASPMSPIDEEDPFAPQPIEHKEIPSPPDDWDSMPDVISDAFPNPEKLG